MKKILEIDDRHVCINALRQLKTYLAHTYIPIDYIDSDLLDNIQEDLLAFFRSEDENEAKKYLKAMGIALLMAVDDCPEIPDEKKEAVFYKLQNQLFDSACASREYYHYKMGLGKYKEYGFDDPAARKLFEKSIGGIKIVTKVQFLNKCKNLAKRYGKRFLLTWVVYGQFTDPGTATVLTSLTLIAQALIPKRWKGEIKEYAMELKHQAEKSLKVLADIGMRYLETKEWGPKVIELAHTASSIMKEISLEVKTMVKNNYELFKNKMKGYYTNLKSKITANN